MSRRPEAGDDRVAEQAADRHRKRIGGVAARRGVGARGLDGGRGYSALQSVTAPSSAKQRKAEHAEAEHRPARQDEARARRGGLALSQRLPAAIGGEGEEDDAGRHRAAAVAPARGDDGGAGDRRPPGRRRSRSRGTTTWSAAAGLLDLGGLDVDRDVERRPVAAPKRKARRRGTARCRRGSAAGSGRRRRRSAPAVGMREPKRPSAQPVSGMAGHRADRHDEEGEAEDGRVDAEAGAGRAGCAPPRGRDRRRGGRRRSRRRPGRGTAR